VTPSLTHDQTFIGDCREMHGVSGKIVAGRSWRPGPSPALSSAAWGCQSLISHARWIVSTTVCSKERYVTPSSFTAV
jgi:hypothetical protein